MANESTVDQQQLQSTIDELYRKLSELFPAQRDALRNALNTIQVGENQTLGMLAAADDLATAPVGDQASLMEAIGLGALVGALNAADLSAFRAAVGMGDLATLDSVNNNTWIGSDLSIENGGTGASDASSARINLGLGSAAVQPDSRYAKLSGANNFGSMPTIGGAPLVESGSNSNGFYARFADGSQFCFNNYIKSNFDEYFAAPTFNFPASFKNGEYPFASIVARDQRDVSGASTNYIQSDPYLRTLNNTQAVFYIDRDRVNNKPDVYAAIVVTAFAFGRWK